MKLAHLVLPLLLTFNTQAGFGDFLLGKMNLDCKSHGGYKECNVIGTVVKMKLKKEYSRKKCFKNETYGVDIVGGFVWVDQQCKGKFELKGISLRNGEDENKIWSCKVEAFGNVFYGEGERRSEAERRAMTECGKNYHQMHCDIEKCTQE